MITYYTAQSVTASGDQQTNCTTISKILYLQFSDCGTEIVLDTTGPPHNTGLSMWHSFYCYNNSTLQLQTEFI